MIRERNNIIAQCPRSCGTSLACQNGITNIFLHNDTIKQINNYGLTLLKKILKYVLVNQ